MLLVMQFLTGLEGNYYQENIDGRVTRWFDKDGNDFVLPENGGAGVSYRLLDDNPEIPSWYVDPTIPVDPTPVVDPTQSSDV